MSWIRKTIIVIIIIIIIITIIIIIIIATLDTPRWLTLNLMQVGRDEKKSFCTVRLTWTLDQKSSIYIYIYIYVYVSVLCLTACTQSMHVRIYVCMYVCTHLLCVYVWVLLRTYIRTYVRIYEFMYFWSMYAGHPIQWDKENNDLQIFLGRGYGAVNINVGDTWLRV